MCRKKAPLLYKGLFSTAVARCGTAYGSRLEIPWGWKSGKGEGKKADFLSWLGVS